MLQGKQEGKGNEGWREGTAKADGEWTRGGRQNAVVVSGSSRVLCNVI